MEDRGRRPALTSSPLSLAPTYCLHLPLLLAPTPSAVQVTIHASPRGFASLELAGLAVHEMVNSQRMALEFIIEHNVT